MPDGFEPHVELTRIFTLREMMQECRALWPDVQKVVTEALSDEDVYVRLKAAEFVTNRGFGKPRQHIMISTESANSRRVLVLPDNQRKNQLPGPVIDAES